MDLPSPLDIIDRTLRSDIVTVHGGYQRVIAHCRQERPHADWDELAAIDVESNLHQLDAWLVELLESTPPPDEITGYWFGLHNPIDDGETTADLYVSGNPYIPERADWASGPRWTPPGCDAESEALRAIYRIAYRPGGLENDAEYPLCLAYASLALRELASRNHALLRGDLPERVIVCGFDSGDCLCIGAVRRPGFVLSSTADRFEPLHS